MSGITNLVTLKLTELPASHQIYEYFGSSASNVPITLKNIVLESGCDVRSTRLLSYIAGVTVFVEAERADCPWDEDYPGWSNGNKVAYGGAWYRVTFLDNTGAVLADDYYLSGEVIRPPFVSLPQPGDYAYVLAGWDLDGDGKPDSLPATGMGSITAVAVIEKVRASYRIDFLGADGKPLYTYYLSYNDVIPTPATPAKKGYIFLGWQGFTAGQTVTGNLRISSAWQHEGEGHVFADEVVPPTCKDYGYTRHYCTVCGEETRTDLLPATGHLWGDWTTDLAATCTENGSRHRTCATCSETETDFIPAAGHQYTDTVISAATCKKTGQVKSVCTVCGDTVTETLSKLPHRYIKKTASKSFLEWLIERVLNIFFGYEGNQAYYYKCADCGTIKTYDEDSLSGAASVKDVCDHYTGEWDEVIAPTCDHEGVLVYHCTECQKTLEAVELPIDDTAHTPGEWQTAENGDYRYRLCTECGEETEREWLCDRLLTFAGHSCSFHNNLTLNYYVDANLAVLYDNLRLVIVRVVYDKDGNKTTETVTLTGEPATVNGKQYLRFTYTGIAAAQLGSDISARLYAGQDESLCHGPEDNYNLKTYAYNRLAASKDGKFKALMVDLLNYCSAAQVYFGIRTDALVNAELTEEQKALAGTAGTYENIAALTPLEGATATFFGNSILFNNNVVLKSYLDLSGIEDLSKVAFRIRMTDSDGTVSTTEIPFAEFSPATVSGKAAYTVSFSGIAASQFGSKLELTVLNDGVAVSGTYTYSIESYVARRMENSTDENFKALLAEMMKYSAAADAYLQEGN